MSGKLTNEELMKKLTGGQGGSSKDSTLKAQRNTSAEELEKSRQRAAQLVASAGSEKNDSMGGSKLRMAVTEEDIDLVEELLVEKKVDPNSVNKAGWTALHVAASHGGVSIMKLLIQYGAGVNLTDESGETPLMCACRKGKFKEVKLLLQHNPDLNTQNKDGETALHAATDIGSARIVKALLQQGALPDLTNQYGETPLHFAANQGHTEVVEHLIAFECDAKVMSDQGATAEEFALWAENYEALDLIRNYLKIPLADRVYSGTQFTRQYTDFTDANKERYFEMVKEEEEELEKEMALLQEKLKRAEERKQELMRSAQNTTRNKDEHQKKIETQMKALHKEQEAEVLSNYRRLQEKMEKAEKRRLDHLAEKKLRAGEKTAREKDKDTEGKTEEDRAWEQRQSHLRDRMEQAKGQVAVLTKGASTQRKLPTPRVVKNAESNPEKVRKVKFPDDNNLRQSGRSKSQGQEHKVARPSTTLGNRRGSLGKMSNDPSQSRGFATLMTGGARSSTQKKLQNTGRSSPTGGSSSKAAVKPSFSLQLKKTTPVPTH